MKPMKFGIGQPIRRVEDAKFVTGQGCYTSDLSPAGTVHAVFWVRAVPGPAIPIDTVTAWPSQASCPRTDLNSLSASAAGS